jgi:N-methylhydantoinase B
MNANFVQMALRCLLGADIPNTAGFFRPIKINAPPGRFVNPLPPAAVGARVLGGRRINHAVWGALAQMAPDRVFACPGGSDASMASSGLDRTVYPPLGADRGLQRDRLRWRPDKDGMEGQGSNVTNQANTPVEILETEYPIRIVEYGFAPDTEGAGKFRGGLGLVRSFEYFEDGIEVRTRCDRLKHPPWGLFGGGCAAPGGVSLRSDGDERRLPGKSVVTVKRGDVLRTQWCGGGGYGDPLARDPGRVLADVIAEKITPARAREVYGVVIDLPRRRVDRAATATLRKAAATVEC